MHKNAMKCNKTQSKWCKNKHGASKIIDTLETYQHSLIYCNLSRFVWALSKPDIVDHVALLPEPTTKLWLFSMIETMKEADLIRMVMTLWEIWHAKRKAVHEEIFQSPMATTGFVNRFIVDLEVSRPMQQPKKVHSPTPSRSAVRWIGPPVGKAKANANVAIAKRVAKGAVGAVWEEGVFLGASAVVFDGIASPEIMEALACQESMMISMLGQCTSPLIV
jgi:hypothetical protein